MGATTVNGFGSVCQKLTPLEYFILDSDIIFTFPNQKSIVVLDTTTLKQGA
jgi:hypothetical protein